MKTFFYTAHSAEGIERRATMKAETTQQVRDFVTQQGMTLLTVTEQIKKPSAFAALIHSPFSHISLTERALFSQNLYIMVKSGMSLTQSFLTLAQQTKNKTMQRILEEMRLDIEAGGTFAKALNRQSRYFSEMYINMVAAGEASGKLENVLQELSRQLKKERALKSKVRSAMMYPSIIVIAMLLMGVGLIVFVIPRLKDIYRELNADLPAPTKILIAISDFVVSNGILTIIAMAILFFLARWFSRSKFGRRFLHRVILRLPIASTIVKKTHLAQFSRTLASLLSTDIPIVQSFTIIEHTLPNVHYREAVAIAAESLKKGKSIFEALAQRPNLFPPMVTQMVSVGETSGKLDELAGDLADFYETDVDETLSSFSTIIEPVLILLLGIGVAAIAVSVLLPIYSISENI